MAAPEPTTSPASVASAAREELLSTGPGTIPNTQVPPSGFAAAILPMLGKVLGTAGLLGASAAIPGFGQAYVQAQQHAENQALAARGQLLRTLQKEPSLVFQPGMEATMRKQLGPQLAESLIAEAHNQRSQEAVAQAMAQFARENTPAPGGFVPLSSPEGETMGLVSPFGAGVAQGAPQLTYPTPPAGILPGGQVQRETKVGPKGEVTTTLGPTPTGEKERGARIATTKRIAQEARQLQQMRGLDGNSARIAAIHSAALRGDDLSQLSPEDRALLELQDPLGGGGLGTAARRETEVGTAKGQVEQEQPLTRGELALLRTPEGEKLPFGTTGTQARGLGAVSLTTGEVNAVQAYEGGISTLDEFRQLAEPTFKGVTEDSDAQKALAGRFMRSHLNPNSNEAQLLSLQGSLASLVRLLGEKGVLTEPDIARAQRLIPGRLETEVSWKRKLDRLERLLDARVTSAGIDVNEVKTRARQTAARALTPAPEASAPAGADNPGVQQILQQLPPGSRFLGIVQPQ